MIRRRRGAGIPRIRPHSSRRGNQKWHHQAALRNTVPQRSVLNGNEPN
jgi:hypothetical protein